MTNREWYVVDATDKILGRLSSTIIKYLTGKHKPNYSPHNDQGDYVVILNARKVYVSGKKRKNKIYYRHTGYIGGLKKITFKDMLKKDPRKVIEISIKGMLPKNSLGRVFFRRLKVYPGLEHNHKTQLFKSLNNLPLLINNKNR